MFDELKIMRSYLLPSYYKIYCHLARGIVQVYILFFSVNHLCDDPCCTLDDQILAFLCLMTSDIVGFGFIFATFQYDDWQPSFCQHPSNMITGIVSCMVAPGSYPLTCTQFSWHTVGMSKVQPASKVSEGCSKSHSMCDNQNGGDCNSIILMVCACMWVDWRVFIQTIITAYHHFEVIVSNRRCLFECSSRRKILRHQNNH